MRSIGTMISTVGSSPHTRGARAVVCRAVRRAGIIPAYAGSTSSIVGLTKLARDHPRIRGEHSRSLTSRVSIPGSSPHTRGARGRPAQGRRRGGIIPAYAGSTSMARFCTRSSRDHPRIRGEHRKNSASTLASLGSSPHTRGARHIDRRRLGVAGIIPAYAGSTWTSTGCCAGTRDHPRIRGEHS